MYLFFSIWLNKKKPIYVSIGLWFFYQEINGIIKRIAMALFVSFLFRNIAF